VTASQVITGQPPDREDNPVAGRLPLAALPDATLIVDRTGRIRAANELAAKLFGYPLAEMLTLISDHLVAEALRPRHAAWRVAFFEPQGSDSKGLLIESAGRRCDGSEFPVEIAVRAMAVSDEVLAVATIRDISRHRKIEQALGERVAEVERVAAGRDRFFVTMSHDLRAPLNAIIGFAGTLLMKLPGPLNDAQEHQLDIIRSSGQQLLSLLNDVIDLAKMQSGRVTPKKEAFDCGAAMEEVATRLRHHAERKHLQLGVEVELPLRVVSDRRAVQQILHQLLDNAIKFSDRGAVTMGLRALEREGHGWIEVSVKDEGAGLQEAACAQLRESLQNPDVPVALGNGLGLYLARKFAQLIGAHLELESEPDTGCRFSLLLPME
jgi:protein-histidine pros-kinase